MALPTATAIRALVLPALTGTAEDTLLDLLIAAADARLADWCAVPPATPGGDSTLETTAYTVYLDGPCRDPRVLDVGLRPITTLTSVKQDTDGDWSYASTESSSDYTLDGRHGKVYANPGSALAWGSGLRHIQVVCSAGYNVGAHVILTRAIALLVSEWLARRTSTDAIVSESLAADTRQYRDGGLSPAVLELMWPYRLGR